ncbi:MAG TPA: hypothetical protein ENL20_03790 [Candidatus Cloacimonetes bacterium]|nr:hypothetical protein [Candidatus Cloacimonadota bacterium]
MIKKFFLFLFLVLLTFCCDDDSKAYLINIRNESEFCLQNISIEMETFNKELPDSVFIDSMSTQLESETFKFIFDRMSDNCGCSRTGSPFLAAFQGIYTQHDSLKYFDIVMDGRDSDFVTVVIDNESYFVEEN